MGILLASIFATIIGAITGIVTSVQTNQQNAESVEKTNEANLEAVRETNAANAEQAELAYKRSLPAQQIADMRAAGVSLPAAIQKLTGGGTYQMPTLQAGSSQAKQFDYSGIAAAAERLGGIPSNVQQARMQDLQMESIKQQMQLKQHEALRADEQHQFDMWQKMYGKDATLKIDALSSEIVSMAADKGISLDGIDSVDKLVNAFDLKHNSIWRNMPNMARSQVLEGVRLQAADNRAQQQQNNANVAANDAHIRSVIESDSARVQLEHLKDTIKEWNDSKDLRAKQRNLELINTQLQTIAAECGLSDAEYRQALIYARDSDGKLSNKEDLRRAFGSAADGFDAFWRGVFKIIPINSLGKSILEGLVKL